MSVRAYSGQFMEKWQNIRIHGRWAEVEAGRIEGVSEDCVEIKGQCGDYVDITGATLHMVVKAVMEAAPVDMKRKMIEHLEALIKKHEEIRYDTRTSKSCCRSKRH